MFESLLQVGQLSFLEKIEIFCGSPRPLTVSDKLALCQLRTIFHAGLDIFSAPEYGGAKFKSIAAINLRR
jgi:hypothetical protein